MLEELKPNDELLNLTYNTDGGWYINFNRSDTERAMENPCLP